MVEQVTAFRDSKGDLHLDKRQAQLADSLLTLQNLGLSEGAAKNIITSADRCQRVIDALEPFAVNEAAAEVVSHG